MPIIKALESILDTSILRMTPLSGGDINEARLVETQKGAFFLKSNHLPTAPAMFAAEAQGLTTLSNSQILRIPKIIHRGEVAGEAYLLLEYIEEASPVSNTSWEKFGRQLAQLHQQTSSRFGSGQSNFIGSLPQSNGSHLKWVAFYTYERLQPQVELAQERQLLQPEHIDVFEQFYPLLYDLCPEEPPALIHGDLWSGNYLIDQLGSPVLIDPSVSYAHREMDMAMTHLFGGFTTHFYAAYQEVYPLEEGFHLRMDIYQLYYLLVHLNLFGKSYLRSIEQILVRYVGKRV